MCELNINSSIVLRWYKLQPMAASMLLLVQAEIKCQKKTKRERRQISKLQFDVKESHSNLLATELKCIVPHMSKHCPSYLPAFFLFSCSNKITHLIFFLKVFAVLLAANNLPSHRQKKLMNSVMTQCYLSLIYDYSLSEKCLPLTRKVTSL